MILKLFRVKVGSNDTFTNSYVVIDETTKDAILIDAPDAIDKIYNYIEQLNANLKYIILTHCHADHISGLIKLKAYYPGAIILIHESEMDAMLDDSITLCSFLNVPVNTIKADKGLKDGEMVEFGNSVAKIIHTPGHTRGSISILIEDALFSGDTLFKKAYRKN